MATEINTIKQWFVTGAKPTQAQFWAWLESYRHKDEAILISEIQGLASALGAKLDVTALAAQLSNYYTKTETDANIQTKITELVDSSPEVLNTLNELAIALGNDPNFATTITNLIATKLDAESTIDGGTI